MKSYVCKSNSVRRDMNRSLMVGNPGSCGEYDEQRQEASIQEDCCGGGRQKTRSMKTTMEEEGRKHFCTLQKLWTRSGFPGVPVLVENEVLGVVTGGSGRCWS